MKNIFLIFCILVIVTSCQTTKKISISSNSDSTSIIVDNTERISNSEYIERSKYTYFWNSIEISMKAEGYISETFIIKPKLDYKAAGLNTGIMILISFLNIALGVNENFRLNLYVGFACLPFSILPWLNSYEYENSYIFELENSK